MKINYALIGLGRSGYFIHYKALLQKKNYKLVALCDKNFDRLKQFKLNKNIYQTKDYKKLLSIQNLNLVIISTNTKYIYDLAIFFIKKKINVVVEKPFTKNIYQFKNLINISQKYDVKIFPFFNFRYSEDFTMIKSLIKKKIIGKSFHIKRFETYFNRRDDWQSKKKQLGGILNAAAIHQIDQLLNLKKIKIKDLFSVKNKIVTKGNADDHLKIIFNDHNNIIYELETSWASSIIQPKWLILGSKGTIYQKNNIIFIKYFNDKDVKFTKRNNFSYLSNEKINWKYKKYILKNNNDIYSANIFYTKLILKLRKKSEYNESIKQALETMQLINKYIK